MKGSDSSDIKYNNRPQSLNGFEEMVEFLPAANSKKVEKMSLKKKLLIAGLVVGAFLLSLTAGLLIWHFAYRNTPVQKIYTGSLRVTNYPFIDAYENPSSPEFADLSAKVIETLQKTYQTNRALGPHFVQSNVTAFSEGSVISYYWTEFSVPKYLEAKLDAAMSNLKVQTVTLRQRTALSVDSLVAYPVDPLLARNFRDNKCIFFLHSSPGSVTKFSSPGFPNSPYPPNSRCQWALRADAGHMVVLHFKTFKMESCKPPKGDYVHIYDSLTAMEPRLMKDLCGSYPPSYNLTFISSQNVMLVTLGSDDKEKHPGFMAEFFQIPKTTLCGGTIRNAAEGVISSPFYPAHYPPNRDCIWEIEVPADKFVKVRFQMFYLYEPGVSVNSCPKDYVEIDNKRYCGERSPFVISNNSSKITVKFHSDQSYSDTGFTAQYIPYEPQNPCPDQFTCKSGRCIDKSRNCDGWNDCGDSSDEQMCVCTAQQFRCKTSQYCKPRFFLCDGVNDCGDGSDEQDCKCPDNFLKCRNGKCIPVAQKCDNTDNCGDGTDESDCGSAQDTTCTDYTYKCDDGKCINKLNPDCDGVKDCADGSDEAFCNCGKRPYSRKTRIVGGVNADIGEWPWQVSLQTKKDGHTCGASLVSPTILLSAAHCFQDTSGLRYSDPSVWTAYLGLHDQGTKTTSKDVVVRKIKRVVTNRGFNDYTYDNDIAMLELESPVTYTDFIQPICIPEATHVFPVGKQIWVTGWGALTEGGIGASILQKAEIRVINQTECNKLLEDQLTARMICAGYVSGGIDACQGDSGGPLSSVEVNGKVYLAGIVSWGEGCARRNKPGVYTKVTAMRDWIKQNTGL